VEASRGFVWQSLAISLAFKLGGLGLGWLIYGRRPMRVGETDRVEAAMRRVWLGWLYEAMRDRFYLDEIYQATFVRGSTLLADLFQAFDREAVDGLVNQVGRVGWVISWVGDWFDTHIVDAMVNWAGYVQKSTSEISDTLDRRVADPVVDLIGLGTRVFSNLSNTVDLEVVDSTVDGVGDTIRAGGRFIRPIQTGRVQNYLLLAFLMLLAFVVTLMTILLLTTR
jgi:NADH:ubiquinone oxidoreductase subunit 5 (subunit L)/multisubunit Na+/H+ antiporter MnhA subunit